MAPSIFGFIPSGIGTTELLIFGVIALLLYGSKLPEVARSLGKGLVEFKKGIRGIEDEIHGAGSSNYYQGNSTPSSRPIAEDDRLETNAPKFEPPKFEPTSTENNQPTA
ncbi:MAG: twin-arginine translocase TatA/TatE family subunit [Planctomycetales bacterium]